MIRIKDFIFNENDLNTIAKIDDKLRIDLKNSNRYVYIHANIEDIEWNYGEKEDTPKEDKKIEKLDLKDDGNTITLFGEKENEWTILDNVDIIVCNKINEIIDKIMEENK